jgi:hypothetical protein
MACFSRRYQQDVAGAGGGFLAFHDLAASPLTGIRIDSR